MSNIPEEVKEKIRLIASHYYPVASRPDFKKCLEQGYSLASETIVEKDKEIERLIGLVNLSNDIIVGFQADVYNHEKYLKWSDEINKFKTENKL